MTQSWQDIFDCGEGSLAVWQQHSRSVTLRGLTLALPPAAQAVADAEDSVDDVRATRDSTLAPIQDLAARLPRKVEGHLGRDEMNLLSYRATGSLGGAPERCRGTRARS